MANTKQLKHHTPSRYLHYHNLSVYKSNRIFTKHFANMAQVLPPNELSLLYFLIYRSTDVNTIEYSTHLLKLYEQSHKIIPFEYDTIPLQPIHHSLPSARKALHNLIGCSALLPFGRKRLFIPPTLTHHYKTSDKVIESWNNKYTHYITLYTNKQISHEQLLKHLSDISISYTLTA